MNYSTLPTQELWNQIQQRPYLNLGALRTEMIQLLVNDSKATIKLISYNILRNNDIVSWNGIINILRTELPDIIGLQEVPSIFHDLISQDPVIVSNYSFIKPKYYYDSPYSDAELLLIKGEYNPTFYEPAMLPGTKQNRHTHLATFTINNVPIVVGTCHLESEFFSAYATQTKCSQLTYITNVMKAINPTAVYLVFGDMNLTSGPELNRENICIKNAGLTDVWKILHITNEDENNLLYQQNDITWDGARNTKVKHKEFHRPDRVFLGGATRLTPLSIERIVNNLSDHYGLQAAFRVQ